MSVLASGTQLARVGELLRDWRHRRHLSQLDLASAAEVSARHLSFVETGRAKPSRELVLHLAEHLEIPLRERNHLCWRPATPRPTPRCLWQPSRWNPYAGRSTRSSAATSRTRP